MVKRLKAAFKAFKSPDLIEKTGKDFLTGALLRKSFLKASKREFKRAVRYGQSLALVFVDLDNLKEVNDELGHEEGDRYLKDFVHTTLLHIRPFDILARWGGDEFLLLLSTDEENVEQIIRRIYDSFPNFSWGTSAWDEKEDFSVVLKKADKKMYKMKKSKIKNFQF